MENKEMVNHPDHYGGKNNPYEATRKPTIMLVFFVLWKYLSI